MEGKELCRFFCIEGAIPESEPGEIILLQRKKRQSAASKKAKIRLENKTSFDEAHLLYICQSIVWNMRYEKM